MKSTTRWNQRALEMYNGLPPEEHRQLRSCLESLKKERQIDNEADFSLLPGHRIVWISGGTRCYFAESDIQDSSGTT